MTAKRRFVSHFQIPKIAADEEGNKMTVGIPLAKLIKRRLSDLPEIVMNSASRAPAAEKIRRLKTALTNIPEGAPQVIVVTSPGAGEGKSILAINLALAFAADKRGEVLLVDGDLRRPTVGEWVTPPPKLGLSELANKQADVDDAVLHLEDTPLKILPAGSPPSNPAELLGSDHTKALFCSLRDRFHTIIVDTPPIIPFTDADILGGLSDGLVLLARAWQTEKSTIHKAASLVTSTRILGAVLNGATPCLADWGQEGGGYDKYYNSKRKK